VAVSLSVSTDAASLPIAYELYLPETWSEDPERRRKAGVFWFSVKRRTENW
jgi:SRSO17 transposase